ncbi:putative F-box protein At1g60370 [Benincasa hispida]|uniref:putative F-box protein At1g60370 n=1 Tax=Benincasa hispida TaxID=102211 RepID=UPI0018FFD4FB|nr:putative F-box protein At1g60370 [Benincasa hispida]
MEKKRNSEIRKSSDSELPPDNIIQVILSKVPLFNLPSCRLVCKAWNNLVLTCKFDPPLLISSLSLAYDCPSRNLYCMDFNLKYLEGMSSVVSFTFHPKFFTSSISIINSCNGLLSLLISKRKSGSPISYVLCILNPMTNEYFKFPAEKSKTHCCCGRPYSYGLGFSPETKQYKIARTSFLRDESTTSVEIFAFGTTREWTPVGVLPSLVVEDHGVYFNGGLYWTVDELQPRDSNNAIYRLDIENEKLEKISCPHYGGGHFFFGVFDGTLYLTTYTGTVDNIYQVWKMEENLSWIKAFVLSRPENLRHPEHDQPWGVSQLQPIKVCEDGKILCLLAGFLLILYDPKTKRVKILTNQDVETERHLHVHQIDSSNFNSLPNILAGKS